jgi:hypothetical protein
MKEVGPWHDWKILSNRMDGSDQAAQWIDFKFAHNVDHSPI